MAYPYFRLKANGKKNMAVRYMGSIGEETQVTDEVYLPKKLSPQFDVYGRDSIYIEPIDGFDIFGKISWCNISGDHLIKESRYPYIYLTIYYNKKIIFGELIKIYLSIEYDKSNITDNKQYNDLIFSGNWIEHCDGELKEEKKYNYTGKDDAINYLLNKCSDKEFINSLQKILKMREDERKKKFNLEKIEYAIPKSITSTNSLLDRLKELGEI